MTFEEAAVTFARERIRAENAERQVAQLTEENAKLKEQVAKLEAALSSSPERADGH